MRKIQLWLHYKSDSKLGTWLLASAVLSMTFLYTICTPGGVPGCVAQAAKISKQLSADINSNGRTALGGTAVTDIPQAGRGTAAGAADIYGEPTDRKPASVVQPKREKAICGAAKTSKSKRSLMIPPPPPTPCLLSPAFGFFLMQPAQQYAASRQQLQQAQAHTSLKTHTQTATRENTPQQSDQELQAADQELQAADLELQAALRSSLITVGEWKR